MGFSFWSQAMMQVYRKQPKTVAELKSTVEEFAANLGEDAIRKMALHARRQALAVLLLRAVTSSIA